VIRFFELVRSAIGSGQAHVASTEGTPPANPDAWGWRDRVIGAGQHERSEWSPQGVCVGWLQDEHLFLDPDAAHRIAQRSGDGINIGAKTLSKRLRERGKLVSVDATRGTNTVRRTLIGKRRDVLHVNVSDVWAQKPDQSAQSDQRDEKSRTYTTSWSDAGVSSRRADHQNLTTESDQNRGNSLNVGGHGQDGQIGQEPQADTPSSGRADDGDDAAELEEGVL
jgi:hypothetical protein